MDPASIFYKFEAQFLPSLPAYQPYVKEAKLGVIGGRVQMISKDGGETNNINRLFMAPHLVRAQSAYKDIKIHSF